MTRYSTLGFPAWGISDGEGIVARRVDGRWRDIPSSVVGDREFWEALVRAEAERATVPEGGNA